MGPSVFVKKTCPCSYSSHGARCAYGDGRGQWGNGATTFTQTDHAVAESFPSPNPCTLDPGTVSDVHNDVFHGTINKTGSPLVTHVNMRA